MVVITLFSLVLSWHTYSGSVLEDIPANKPLQNGKHIDYGAAYETIHVQKIEHLGRPAEGIEGVKEAILTAVKDAGPNACPPMVIGVGIGGTFEKCALMAKQALTRNIKERSPITYVANLENELLEKINALGIGPGGLCGKATALAVNINTYPTHIAGLPVAVNICCHVNRHITREV